MNSILHKRRLVAITSTVLDLAGALSDSALRTKSFLFIRGVSQRLMVAVASNVEMKKYRIMSMLNLYPVRIFSIVLNFAPSVVRHKLRIAVWETLSKVGPAVGIHVNKNFFRRYDVVNVGFPIHLRYFLNTNPSPALGRPIAD